MLFMLLLNSVQSLTVLRFWAQWMVLAALLTQYLYMILSTALFTMVYFGNLGTLDNVMEVTSWWRNDELGPLVNVVEN